MRKIISIACLMVCLSPVIALAQSGGNANGGAGGNATGGSGGSSQPITFSIPNPVGGADSLSGLIFLLVNFVISFSYVVIAFFLIWSGFKFVTAQGSEDKLKDAKRSFTYTIIGAVLIIGAQVIVDLLKDILTQVSNP